MKTLIFIITMIGLGGMARAADASPAYPLTTCVVSGKKLGGMGEPYVFKHEGQEVRLCCKHCKPDFDKDPAKYLEKLREKQGS